MRCYEWMASYVIMCTYILLRGKKRSLRVIAWKLYRCKSLVNCIQLIVETYGHSCDKLDTKKLMRWNIVLCMLCYVIIHQVCCLIDIVSMCLQFQLPSLKRVDLEESRTWNGLLLCALVLVARIVVNI